MPIIYPALSPINQSARQHEVGDFQRFATARAFMAYLGLVPSEHSSGESRRRGGITKSGNGHVRRILVESAWSYRFRPRMSSQIRERNEGLSPSVQASAWKAQQRLHSRYQKLLGRGKASALAKNGPLLLPRNGPGCDRRSAGDRGVRRAERRRAAE